MIVTTTDTIPGKTLPKPEGLYEEVQCGLATLAKTSWLRLET